MKTTKDTRSTILDVAQDMVQRQSISGVSFQELANRIGIKKGSMYYHFESKDELSIAMLERATEDLKASFKRGKHKSATEQLRYFFAIYFRIIGPGQRMCPGGAFAGEWDKLSEPVHQSVRAVLNAQIEGVEEIIVAGVSKGEFADHGQSPKALASWIISCLQGAILTSRVEENDTHFNFAVNTIERYLGLTT